MEVGGMRVLAPLFLVLALAGCGRAEAAKVEPEAAYLAVLKETGVIPASGVDDLALDLGHQVCATFDRGSTWGGAVASIHRAGWDGYDTGVIVGAATGAFCPEYGELAPGS
jgi:hypothetical protein